VLRNLNWVRLYLKVLLPIELVGVNGIKTTTIFLDNKQSLIKWNFKWIQVPKPIASSMKICTSFKNWLRVERIQTAINFIANTQCSWKLLTDNEILNITEANETKFYKAIRNRANNRIYHEDYSVETNQVKWRNIIGAFYNSGELKNISVIEQSS